MINKLVSAACEKILGVECFTNNNNNSNNNNVKLILGLVLILVYLILILLFSKLLWNSCIVSLLPVKKCNNVWHLVGLAVLGGILFPGRGASQ